MSPLAFDTHSFVKRLTEAGMPEPQAEVSVLRDKRGCLNINWRPNRGYC